MEQAVITRGTEETRALGRTAAAEIAPGTLLCLSGELGTGKTTFTQGFLGALDAPRPYVSPTFVIMKEYVLPRASATGIQRVYHADAYRVEPRDLETLGFAEWCADPKGIVLLEWPERIRDLLPKPRWELRFTWMSQTERSIALTKVH